jgi:hypothetical protein
MRAVTLQKHIAESGALDDEAETEQGEGAAR